MKLSLLLVVAAAASARAAVPLALDLTGCPNVPSAPVERLVGIELRASLVPARDRITHVVVRCFGDQAQLEVNDPLTGKSLGRSINLSAVGTAGQPRLLALSIIELVSTSWTELESEPSVGAASAAEVQQALSTVRTLRPKRGVQLAAVAQVHGWFAGTGPVAGAALRLVTDIPKQMAIPVELGYERGEATFTIGSISTDLLTASVGLAWRREGRHLGVRLGGGVRGGAARFDGRPIDSTVRGGSVWVPWIAPDLRLVGSYRPSRRVALELGIDAGWAFAPTAARVAGVNAVEISGPFIGASLALAIGVGG